MKSNKFFILPMLAILLVFVCTCNHSGSRDNKITISGAFALYPLTVKWAEEYMKRHPSVQIDISAGGAGKGMTDVLSDMVDLGMVSREVAPVEIEKGAFKIAVARDAVVPVFNSSNPYTKQILERGADSNQLVNIFITGRLTKWGELGIITDKPSEIHVFTRSDACGAAAMWASYLGKDQEDLIGTGVFGDPGIADAVKNDIWGLGYNNIVYVFELKTGNKNFGMEIIPIDLNSNGTIDADENFYGTIDAMTLAIKEGKYPSPPARDLYLVTKGKPSHAAVVHFLKWILTAGQKYIDEAGYIKLSDFQLRSEQKKLRQDRLIKKISAAKNQN